MKRFEDKVVIVTGAASGIGKATALRISREGGQLALIDVDEEKLAETVAEAGTAKGFRCDLEAHASIATTIEAIAAEFGKIDALCNVAGILRSGHSHEFPLDTWNQVVAINLTGTFLTCQAAIPHLLKTKGAIVNTSSTAAIGGHPWMAAYAATKGAIISMTHSLASEYMTQGLRANVVLPGGIITAMHGDFQVPEGGDPLLLNRIVPPAGYGEPDMVADAIAFLASSEARYVNGAEFRVDGGMFS